jgi:hypothetical protein
VSASNEKARRANVGRNFHTFYKMNNSTIPCAIESARLRYFARRIHALGDLRLANIADPISYFRVENMKFAGKRERALFELFMELVAGATLANRLPVYAAIDSTILGALSGVALLPPAVRAIGRAFE